ncbi:hypothetical protein Tco_0908218 [Tanacetum coccineum]|uniref:Uncharacterized protein n=1 Tax=Tanacetum coccineum TaxID=301880 RepID=A0ABQ5CPS1_9ASTR
MIFKDCLFLTTYAVSSKEDAAYQRLDFTRKRVRLIPNTAYLVEYIRLLCSGRPPDTAYLPVGYDVSNFLPRQRIDCCSLNNVSCSSKQYGVFCKLNTTERLTKTGTMTKHASEDDLHGSDDTTRKLNMNTEFKIGDKFVKILHDNAFNGIDGGDVIDHTSKVLKILEWIKIPNVDKNQLRLHVFLISLSGHAREWWDNEVKVKSQKMKTDEDDDPDDIADIFNIKGNLFDFETPLWDLEKPWSGNGVPYQLCDHICEPYRFKNEKSKWLTCSSDIDGFCNGGELPEMVRVWCMTYFRDHKWYDELADGGLKEKALIHKAGFEESWGDATPIVMKLCAWLKNSFENFHELDHDVLVKLEESWWKVNTHECAPFTRWKKDGPFLPNQWPLLLE